MNIHSSQAFPKHLTQLYQQPQSWLCQEQAKLQYCRVGHQSTLLSFQARLRLPFGVFPQICFWWMGCCILWIPIYMEICLGGLLEYTCWPCSIFTVSRVHMWDRKLSVSFLITPGFGFISTIPDFYSSLVKSSKKQEVSSARSDCGGCTGLSLHKSSGHIPLILFCPAKTNLKTSLALSTAA